MSAAGFDLIQHHRERTRKAERRAEMFERELAKALRLLGLALRVATTDGADAQPTALLVVLEDLDHATQSPGPSIDKLAILLRETDPDRIP